MTSFAPVCRIIVLEWGGVLKMPNNDQRQSGPLPADAVAPDDPDVMESETTPGDQYRKIFAVAVVVVVLVVLVAMVVAAMFNAREFGRNVQCRYHLAMLCQAMRNYADVYGSFPPAYVADKDGNPLYSWRVLLLPFLDQKRLYRKFHLDERWDSKANKEVSELALGIFQCPSQPNANQPTTNYMMVVGPHTISDGPHGRRPKEITDGPADTITIVEAADSTTWWAEPADLDFNTLSFTVNGGGKKTQISSYHRDGVNAAFCEGPIRLLRSSTNPQLVRAMLTIDGGEHAAEK
jgi:hypothetical protein